MQNLSGTRSQSQVVVDPYDAYNARLADLQRRRDALANTANGGGPSFQDHLNTTLGNWFNEVYGQPTASNVPDADRAQLWNGLYNLTQGAITPDNYNAINPQTGDADPTAGNSAWQGGLKNWIGEDTYNQIADYTPSGPYTPDFSALNAEKKRIEDQAAIDMNNQRSRQAAYNTQLGGGFAGGTIPGASATQALSSVAGSGFTPTTSTTDPVQASVAPWGTPGYSPGGLGGLGGYNPNPWSTSNTNAAQTSNPWGGPFGNRNPFSLGG